MPEKQLWQVEISLSGNVAGTISVSAETAAEAEDIASGEIILSAKKAYTKGQDNEQETKGELVGHTTATT